MFLCGSSQGEYCISGATVNLDSYCDYPIASSLYLNHFGDKVTCQNDGHLISLRSRWACNRRCLNGSTSSLMCLAKVSTLIVANPSFWASFLGLGHTVPGRFSHTYNNTQARTMRVASGGGILDANRCVLGVIVTAWYGWELYWTGLSPWVYWGKRGSNLHLPGIEPLTFPRQPNVLPPGPWSPEGYLSFVSQSFELRIF